MKKVLLKNIRVNDVFYFHPKEYGELPNWCRENLFIAKKNDKGKIYFFDTYWGYSEDTNSKTYAFSEANKLGKLKYSFNLDEVESIDEHNRIYYADIDIFSLHRQHACVPSCINYFIKKGAKRNNGKMLETIDKKISDAKYIIESNIRDLERYAITRNEIEKGNLEIYI